MSISAIQRRRKTRKFTQQLLQKGIEPNNFELNRMLTEYFDNHTLGMPYYAPIKQKPYEESSKDDYNHNFLGFKEDIETIYEANIEANNKAVAMQEYYDLEKNKVRNALTKLNLRIENITEALKSTSHVKQYVQVFDDVYSIEFYGNAKRNIPYTTAFVDLLQKKLYTDKTSAKVNKLGMVNASISIDGLTSFYSCQTDGELEKILTDTIDNVYVISARSIDENEKTITLLLDLGKLTTFNCVMFSYTSTKEMPCELSLSEDGENYISVYDVSSRDYIEWNFNAKTARYIKITCHKPEPDGVITASEDTAYYEYYFMFKNISIAREEFESKSVFVSKLIDFDDLTSTIRLDATDMIFNNTRIDYFIGFDNEVDKIGWDAIDNHKDHKLFMFEKRHKILNAHVDAGDFGTQGTVTHLYKLYKLPNTVNRNSIKVTPAYNMWDVKRYTRKTGDSNDDGFSLVTGDFSEHIDKCNMTQLFMDCENYDGFQIRTNVLYVMTQYISLEQSMNLYNKFIRITDTECQSNVAGAEIRVFLNGYEVTPSETNKYSFGLHKGVNKIQIAIYCPSNNALEKRLYHNLNFKELTNDVFGCVPMKYTTNTILDKMVGETYKYYTIKDGYIYVKCNPDDMIHSDLEDMGYFTSYYCLREDMVDYFTDNHIKFRIMAVLTSNDKNVSPELINFRITGR